MIAKRFRLTEREVKKVLSKGKPFFAYGIVLNKSFNKNGCNRFAIVIGGKSVNTNVTRTFFRRRFYDLVMRSSLLLTCAKGSANMGTDFVFVVKKKTKLDKKDNEAIKNFEKDLNFLIKKVR